MKRIVSYAAALALLIALGQIGWMVCDGLRCVTGEPERAPAPWAMPMAVEEPRLVTFNLDDEVLGARTPLEVRQQTLDWLLVTVVSAAATSVGEAREALYDVPPLRRGYLEPVASFEYGVTRSRYTGHGQVIALVPKASDAQRRDHLAQIADEQYKNTGALPKTIEVFEYDLMPGENRAQITRRAPVAGDAVFTDRYGYRQETIRSLEDLQRFMAGIDDVTSARLESGALLLGGRKLQGTPYRGLRIEDVAAIWQAEAKLQKIHAELETFERRWGSRTYRTESEKQRLLAQRKRERTELIARIGPDRLVQHIGFSLDPAHDYEGLSAWFVRSEPLFRVVAESDKSIPADAVEAARTGLARRDVVPLLKLVDHVSKNRQFARLGMVGEMALRQFAFQSARYDGELRGTEVGMVLFYTDLLAKLWALDYMQSAPTNRQVEDFVPLLKVSVAPIYWKEEEELRNTRLWFGPQDRGFQIGTARDTVLFGRNATRVYAASSNPLVPGKESEPNAASAAFLSWWDRHYEAIAAYEPEYQRLNEIMKWSLIASWLAQRHSLDRLEFLGQQTVERGHWFPDWVTRHPELKFRAWSRVAFLPRGHKGTVTESLPLLESEAYTANGRTTGYSGGVSLGSKQLFERAPLSEHIAPLLRRPHLDYGATNAGKGILRTLDKTEYTLAKPLGNRADLMAKAPERVKLRGRDVEYRNVAYESSFVREGRAFRIETASGDVPLATLQVEPTANGFRVGLRARDGERATAVVRRLGRHGAKDDTARLLVADPDVERVLTVAGGQEHLFKLHDSPRWVRVSPEGPPQAGISEAAHARLSGFDGGKQAPRFNVAWQKDADVQVLLSKGDAVPVQAPGKVAGGAADVHGPRGPPELRALREHDFPQAARKLVASPKESKEFLADYRAAGIKRADALLAEGKDVDAVRQLNDLLSVFGPGPDLQLRRAVALLGQGKIESAVAAVESAGTAPLRDTQAIRAGVQQRMSRTPVASIEHSSLERFAQYVWLRERLRAQADLDAELRALTGNGTGSFDFYVRVLDQLKGHPVTSPGELRGAIYVDVSSPKLGALDWNASIRAAVDEITSAQLGTVIKLPRWRIAQAEPLYIEEVATKTRYTLRNGVRGGHTRPSSRSSGECTATISPDTECAEDVYVVKAARPQAVSTGR